MVLYTRVEILSKCTRILWVDFGMTFENNPHKLMKEVKTYCNWEHVEIKVKFEDPQTDNLKYV